MVLVYFVRAGEKEGASTAAARWRKFCNVLWQDSANQIAPLVGKLASSH